MSSTASIIFKAVSQAHDAILSVSKASSQDAPTVFWLGLASSRP